MAVEDILETVAARMALESTPEPWLDAARGAISVEEAARRVEGEEDPALVERSKLLFQPGDPVVEEERLESLLRESFVVETPWWRRSLGVGLGLGLAAAAATVLLVPWRGGAPPLPSYALELEGTASMDRAADAAPTDVARFYEDRAFRARLVPWTEVPGQVEAAAYACEDGRPRALPVVPRVAPSGVVVIEGDVAALGMAAGTWELLFVVGTAGTLPQPQTCELGEPSDGATVQRIRTRVEILPPPR